MYWKQVYGFDVTVLRFLFVFIFEYIITLKTIKISVTRHFDFARTSFLKLLLGVFNRSKKNFFTGVRCETIDIRSGMSITVCLDK